MPSWRFREPGFKTLLRIIVGQQLSIAACAAIWTKVEVGIKEITPDAILRADHEYLLCLGFSSQKAKYAKNLAHALKLGYLDLQKLQRQSDQQVLRELTNIKGIGLWTAQIYLMFSLQRSDIWPNCDLVLSKAVQKLFKLENRPQGCNLEKIADRWAPLRSTAAIILWHFYNNLNFKNYSEKLKN